MTLGILGANGFLGSNIARAFLSKNAEVIAFYHISYDKIPVGCRLQSISKAAIFKNQLDILYISVGGHGGTVLEYVNQYDDIRQFIKELCPKRVVFISSVNVYGYHDDLIMITSSFNQPNEYGLSKLFGEFIISSLNNFSIIRLSYIYGIGMKKNSLIPKWVSNAINQKLINVYGDGNRAQDYLHIQDAVNLCVLAGLNSEKKLYLLGASGQSVSNKEVANLIATNVVGAEIKYSGSDDAASWCFNIEDTKQLLGWKPKIEFAQGLKEYIEAYESPRL